MTTRKPSVTYAHKINEGDELVIDGKPRRVEHIRRAQGRKPAKGENLFVTAGGQRLLVNTLAPVRVVRATYEIPLTPAG